MNQVVLLDALGTVEEVAAGLTAPPDPPAPPGPVTAEGAGTPVEAVAGPDGGPARVVAGPDGGPVHVVAGMVAGVVAGPVRVVAAERVPVGPGVVALLVGPENPLTVEQVRALPDLRIVAVTSAGYDHVPLAELTARGVCVTTSAGYCTEEVADHTIALVTGLLRGVHRLDLAVRAGRWDAAEAAPRRIAGAVLGLVGYGRTGRAVGDRARALGMAVRPLGPAASGEETAALLAAADVVSLHLPLTAATRGMFGDRAFAAMRPGAFFVNVARGGLVDETALAAALRSGRLAGAALDVRAAEPPPAGDPLLGCPNLVLTPHAAWYSPESLVRPYRQAGGYVADVLAGRQPAGALPRPPDHAT